MTSCFSKAGWDMPAHSEYSLLEKKLMEKIKPPNKTSPSKQLSMKPCPPQQHPGFQHGAQLPMQVTEAGLGNQLCIYYTLCSGDRVPPSGAVFLKAHAMKAAVSMICPLACTCVN